MEINRHEIAKRELTRQLLAMGLNQSVTSKLVNGKNRPSLKRAAEIEAEIGIPASAWAASETAQLDAMWKIIAGGSK